MTTRKSAAAHEALGDKIPFSHGGVDYLLTPSSEWEYELLEHFEEGRMVAFLKGVLGDEQHNKFKATRPKLGEVNEFVQAIQKALGIRGN